MIIKWLLALLCFALPLSATPAMLADDNLASNIAGVYKHLRCGKWPNGKDRQFEDILEIVPYSDDAIYFRTRLESAGICAVFGIAHKMGTEFLYKGAEDSCQLTLKVQKDGSIVFEDNDMQCAKVSCGVGNHFDKKVFMSQEKRPISYLDRLKKSWQYQSAVKHEEDAAQKN